MLGHLFASRSAGLGLRREEYGGRRTLPRTTRGVGRVPADDRRYPICVGSALLVRSSAIVLKASVDRRAQ